MPPPITSRRSGTVFSSSASVESHTRGSSRNEWQLDRTRTCSDDGVVEVDGGWAVFAFHNQGVSAGELAQAVDHFHFTAFRHASQTAGQLSDDFFFQTRTLSMSVFGSPKTMPCSASALASSITLATCSSALEGYIPRSGKPRPEWNNVQPERFQTLSQRNERLQSNLPGPPQVPRPEF